MKFFIERYTIHKKEENPLWMLVLTCIMTNLMLFFLILYVSSVSPEVNAGLVEGLNRQVAGGSLKEKKAGDILQKFKEKDAAATLKAELQKTGLRDLAEVQLTDKFIRINIAAPILFRSGKAELEPNALQVLPVMGKLLEKFNQHDILIEGHTDNIPVKSGNYPTNWALSAARANSVVDYLAANFSIPQEKLVSAAYGEYRPVAPNDTPEGRARNRRIEIVVARK
ncbi:MAG: flagellar motor protein MotB [Elusimicrobia bacterium]|nr:flagellar motor protein MotB [Elusimicrobiota bacterium]